ncbi:hypothetical protein Y032_0084g1698 [Ancylostoma ceylanicum]|uniref:RNA-directed DNA polymerase n=1 Tax=Ancylostoma ceylanicum TaxID=53326 RepID=A0A016TQP6_9BILA|nr:hypothetical protein Y032_0084g1698 [Ancylostoma ceylanicum]
MDKAIDLDSMVTMMGDGSKHIIVDSSGNSMDFLMLIATDLRVEEAGAARVQMHVQQSMDTTILLGTNALEPLNIRVQMDEMKAQPATLETTATVAKRVVVQPGRTAMIQVSGALADGDCVFWSENRRIMSGVCRGSKGVATVSAVNHEEQPWVIRKGETLGTWSTDTWIDLRTKEVSDMLELTRRNHEHTRNRFEELIIILETNRRAGPLPQDLKQLVHEYKDVFAISDLELSHTNLASPIVLVAKKDGSIRLCVDYREVNKVTKKDSYPLSAIDVTLQGLEGKQFFTSLDLASGYWQVPLTPEAREISAFTTTAGFFEFCVLPFGLTNAPAEFQRLIDKVLGELKGSEVSVYYVILVATETMETHLVVLWGVFDALRRARLKLKPQKSRLMESKLEFLGHYVDQDGVWVDPDKIVRIVEHPTPQNLAELRTFLGMAGYYREFVLRFAHTAKPLYDLTSTKANFVWTEEHQKAFDMLKQHLTTAPVLAQPDVEKARNGSTPFYIYTDASRSGVGAVLAQEGDDGFLHPLHFASEALSRAERNYHVTDQEALAVIFAVQKFHYFIYGVRTIVRTDHASLTSLFRRANVSPRVLRWALELQRYDLHIEHVKGNANCVADALYRRVAKVEGDAEPTSAINEKVVCTIKSSEWLEELRLDPEFAPVVAAVEDQVDQEVRLPRSDKSFNTADFVIEDGRFKLIQADDTLVEVVPKEKRYPLFLEAHKDIMAGHFNAKKMFAQLEMKLFWPGMRHDLVKWCRECQRCFVSDPKSGNIPPLKPIAASKPFQIVGIDLLEMGPTTRGNRCIVTIIDHFTKYLGAYPISDKKAETVAEALFGLWICDGGRWPDILLSDRGAEFENTIVASLCDLMGIQQHFTKGYCPREDGLTERMNGTIVRMLKKKTVVPTEWDVTLPTVVYAYNACPHEATGESPHFLLYGQDPKYPSEIIPRDQLSPSMIDYDQYKIEFLCGLKLARECIQTHSDDYRTRMKASYDSRWKTDSCDTFTGDRVYVKVPMEKGKSRHPKLVVDWSGQYRVLEASQNSALVTLIGENKEPIRVQFDHLLKLPPYIDDTPVDTTTKRGKRGRRRMMGVHRCLRISLNRSHFRLPTTDPGSVDFTCPGSITRHGQQLYCRIAEPWKTFAPYAPLGDLVFPTVYEFARATSILQQSHISNDQKIAHILNSNYVILSSTALGFVLSAYRAKCYHFMQYMDGLLDPTTANTVHPPRSEDDPFDMSELYQQAISWAFAHPWNDNLWRQIRLKPTLVLLPQVFEEHVENFTAKRQMVKSYGKPKSIQDDWFDQEFSAVILFNPTEYSSLINWETAWSRILMTVAEGADLFVLPGPKDDKDWGKSVDMLRDLCEETLALKPSLLPRLRCLLPTQSEMRAAEHPCEIPLKMMAGTSKSYSPHSVKVFFDMTQAFFGQYFSLKPFRCPRQEETTSQQRPRLPLSGGPLREALSYRQWKAQSRSLHREREPMRRHRSRSPERRAERPPKVTNGRFDPYQRTQRSFSQRHGYHEHTSSSYRSPSYNQSHSYAHPSGRR